MSVKKIALYFAVIIILVGATIVLQAKYWLSRNGPSSSGDQTTKVNDIISAKDDVLADQAAPIAPLADQRSGKNPTNNNSLADFNIFKSEKFKALRENILIFREQLGPGKRDPFKPDY